MGLGTTAIGVNVNGRRRAHVVEIDRAGLTWIKSSVSDDKDHGCVEVTVAVGGVLVRCSRDRSGLRMSLSDKAWSDLISWMTVVS
jgi:hypothetical protein